MANQGYTSQFYTNHSEGSRASAQIVAPLIQTLPVGPITSVLDVGCGTGSWAAEFAVLGADVVGVDGDYVDRKVLAIPESQFIAHDLKTPLDLGRRFDLTVSVEVIEHLEPEHAETFVDTLTLHSDVVLFSGAVPYQQLRAGGVHHVNEQWPSHWVQFFAERGFHLFDIVRPMIWDRDMEGVCYQQNLLLFAKGEKAEHLAIANLPTMPVVDLIHPVMYLGKVRPVPLVHRIRRKAAIRTRINRLRSR